MVVVVVVLIICDTKLNKEHVASSRCTVYLYIKKPRYDIDKCILYTKNSSKSHDGDCNNERLQDLSLANQTRSLFHSTKGQKLENALLFTLPEFFAGVGEISRWWQL